MKPTSSAASSTLRKDAHFHDNDDGSSADAEASPSVDDTARLEVERCLLTRILLSQQASEALFASTAAETSDGGATSTPRAECHPREQRHRELLVDAVRGRDRQVTEALHLTRELESLRRELRNVTEECRKLQRENRKRWEQFKKAQVSSPAHNDGDETNTENDDYENVVLRNVIVDLLAVSGLDWYQDDRLREIMMRSTKDHKDD